MMNLSTLPSFYFFPKAISSAGESCMYSKTRQDLLVLTLQKRKKKKNAFISLHFTQLSRRAGAMQFLIQLKG